MISFLRLTFRVTDRGAKLRFALFALGSVVVAAIEGLGVSLIVPLTELLLKDGKQLPRAAQLADHFINISSREQAATVLAVLVLVCISAKAIGAIFLLRWGIGVSLHCEAVIARRLFSRYLTAPAAYHLKHNSAEMQRTLNESLLIVFRRSLPFVMAATADAFTLASVAVVVIVMDPSIAVLAIAYFGAVAVVYQRRIGGRQKLAAKQAHEEIAVRYRQVQEAMRATKELAVLHREEYFVSRFYATKLELADAQRVLIFFQLLPRQFLDLAFVLGAALMAAFAFAVRPTAAALATIGLFLTATFRLVAPLNRVMGASTVTRTAMPAIEQVIADLAALGSLQEMRHETRSAPIEHGRVQLDGVHFRYDEDLPDVLDGVTLTIEPGDDIAIVGTTGAGKTTLLSVLLGLFDPRAGTVSIDGEPLAECRTSWQLSIGYVPQEIVLFDDTVAANVAFGIEHRDEARVRESLRLAEIDDFVAALPDGVDTVVGEHGVRLSGGQRQRIGLARALYNQPRVLVLDEATSSLDSNTESRILDTIATLRGSLTIITVSHRLSTLKHCDRIYFLRDGRVTSVGTFEDLHLLEPEFARLVALAQLDGPAPRAHDNGNGHGALSYEPAVDEPR
jgi:ABC-type multidrug transport system fused ATPase/permease subunit